MKIYTKTGDQGTTSDVLGNRISKADIKIELQGTIDEVNASVGFLRALVQDAKYKSEILDINCTLRDIQYTLFRIGSDISSNLTYQYVTESDITFLEQSIDAMTNTVGALQNFIYYNGNQAAAYCQVIRSVTRRAERVFVRYLDGKNYSLDYQFINRLSDFFFTLARYMNYISEIPEEAMKLK